jgi:roadblock/LC7 domain-containing protein
MADAKPVAFTVETPKAAAVKAAEVVAASPAVAPQAESETPVAGAKFVPARGKSGEWMTLLGDPEKPMPIVAFIRH